MFLLFVIFCSVVDLFFVAHVFSFLLFCSKRQNLSPVCPKPSSAKPEIANQKGRLPSASLSAAKKKLICFKIGFSPFVGPWTLEFLGFHPKFRFCIKFPPWGRVLRPEFCNPGPKIPKNKKWKINCRKLGTMKTYRYESMNPTDLPDLFLTKIVEIKPRENQNLQTKI